MDTRELFGNTEYIKSSVPQYTDAPFFQQLLACTACTCRKEASKVVPGIGPSTAEIIWFGRNPGREEDRLGLPFIGRGGNELTRMCEALGIDRGKTAILNMVKCHTAEDRPPNKEEIQICTERWLPQEFNFLTAAKIIFPLGHQAIQVILGADALSPAKKEGYWTVVKAGQRKFHVCPLNHPGYLLRARRYQISMYDTTLPSVKEYLQKNFKESYERARL